MAPKNQRNKNKQEHHKQPVDQDDEDPRIKPKSIASHILGIYGLSSFNTVLQILRCFFFVWVGYSFGAAILNFSVQTVFDVTANYTATVYHDNVYHICNKFLTNSSCPSYANYTPSGIPYHARLTGYVADHALASVKPYAWEWIYNLLWGLLNSLFLFVLVWELGWSMYAWLDRFLRWRIGNVASLHSEGTRLTIIVDVMWIVGTTLFQTIAALIFATPSTLATFSNCVRSPWCGFGCRMSKQFGTFYISKIWRYFTDSGDSNSTSALDGFRVFCRDLYAKVEAKMKDGDQTLFYARHAHLLRQALSQINVTITCPSDKDIYVPVNISIRDDLVVWPLNKEEDTLLQNFANLLFRRSDLLSNAPSAVVGVRIYIENNGAHYYSRRLDFDTKYLALFEHEVYTKEADGTNKKRLLKSRFTYEAPYLDDSIPYEEYVYNKYIGNLPPSLAKIATVATRRFTPNASQPAPATPPSQEIVSSRFVPPGASNKELEMPAEETEVEDPKEDQQGSKLGLDSKLKEMLNELLEARLNNNAGEQHSNRRKGRDVSTRKSSSSNKSGANSASDSDTTKRSASERSNRSKREKTPGANSKRSTSKRDENDDDGPEQENRPSSKTTEQERSSSQNSNRSASQQKQERSSSKSSNRSAAQKQRSSSNRDAQQQRSASGRSTRSNTVENKKAPAKQPATTGKTPASSPAASSGPVGKGTRPCNFTVVEFPSGSATVKKWVFWAKDEKDQLQQFILSNKGLGENSCWLVSSFLALRELAANLKLGPGASQFLVNLRDAKWCTKEGLKAFKSLVEQHLPGKLGQPFEPVSVINKFGKVFCVAKKLMLFEAIAISTVASPKTPHLCRKSALLECHELADGTTHWTFFYNETQGAGPAAWFNAESPRFSAKVPAKVVVHIWIKKGLDLAVPQAKSKAEQKAAAATTVATNKSVASNSGESSAVAHSDDTAPPSSTGATVASSDTEAIVSQREFPVTFAEVTGEATGKTIEVATSTNPPQPQPPQPLVPSSFSSSGAEPSRGTTKYSRTGPQGKGLTLVQPLDSGNAVPEKQSLLVQPGQEFVTSSTPSPHSSSNNNQGGPSSPRPLSAPSGALSLGLPLSHGTQVLAPSNLLPGADLLGERSQTVGEVHDGFVRQGDRPHSIDHLESRQDRLEQASDSVPTRPSISGSRVGHRQSGGARPGPGDQGLLDSHVAVLGPQGGYLSPQSGSSFLGPWEQPSPSENHGGQGYSRETGSLRSGVGRFVPHMAQDHPATHRQAQGSWTNLPLSPVAPDFVGSQQRSAGCQPGAVLPLGASWSAPSNGESGSSGSHPHGTLGPQESGNSAPLLGLEPHQRKGSQGSSKGRQDALPTTNGGVQEVEPLGSSTEDVNFPLSIQNYTFDLALQGVTPSTSTILKGSSATSVQKQRLLNGRSVTDLKAHIKPLEVTVSMQAVLDLPSKTDDLEFQFTRERVEISRRYLEDPDVYENLPNRSSRSCVKARDVSADDASALRQAGIITDVSDQDVRGRIVVFVVPEWPKDRKRIIQHTKDINQTIEPADKVSFTSISERAQLVQRGSYIAAVDLKAYYTQFPLSDEVSKLMCFRVPNKHGRTDLVRLCRGPTGQSHMVYVAVSTTERLLDFEHYDSVVDQHIDNVVFVGPSREEVHDQMRIFKERCDAVGVTINEDLSSAAKIDDLIKTEEEWCGTHYDLSNKTVRLTQKIVDKIDLSWSLHQGWTYRGFAAHLGLLFYTSLIIETPMHMFFPLFKFLSDASRTMQQADHELWDTPIEIPRQAAAALELWTTIALVNTPRHVSKTSEPNLLMAVDSCADGWGYIAFDELSGDFWCYGERWPEHLKASVPHKLRASTYTEPRGVFNAKTHALARIHASNHPLKDAPRHLLIGNDNKATVATLSRRHNKKSFDLNAIAARDYGCFPQLPSDYVLIPGEKNWVADALSRPTTTKITMDDIRGFTVDDLRILLGVRPGVGGVTCAGERVKRGVIDFPKPFLLVSIVLQKEGMIINLEGILL